MLGLLTAFTAVAGQNELATAIGDTKKEVIQTRNELQATVNSIDALTKQKSGDMKPTFDTFVAQIGKTQTAADTTKKRIEKMVAEADTHFGTWQKEVDSIFNPDLKKKAQKRLQSVQKDYNEVVTDMKQAGSRFSSLLSDLNDIQKTLVHDLNPDGVKSVKSSVSSAQWNLKSARGAINDAIEGLAKIEKSLGTTASQ